MRKNKQEKLQLNDKLEFAFELDDYRFYFCQKKGKYYYWYYRISGNNHLFYLGKYLREKLQQLGLMQEEKADSLIQEFQGQNELQQEQFELAESDDFVATDNRKVEK